MSGMRLLTHSALMVFALSASCGRIVGEDFAGYSEIGCAGNGGATCAGASNIGPSGGRAGAGAAQMQMEGQLAQVMAVQLQAQVVHLQAQVVHLQAQVVHLQAQVVHLQAQVVHLQAQVVQAAPRAAAFLVAPLPQSCGPDAVDARLLCKRLGAERLLQHGP